MRIAEVLVRFPPYRGGVEASVFHLSRALVERGHEIFVICSDEGGGAAKMDGIRITRLPYPFKVANTNIATGILGAILACRPEIIHTHIPTAWFTEWASLAASITSTPLAVTYHNEITGSGVKGTLAHLYNRIFLPRLLKKSRAVIVSHEEYDDSPHLLPFREKVHAIPWGVDSRRFTPSPPPPHPPLRLAFLSILDAHHDYKGLMVVLEAVRTLLDEGVNLSLAIGGEGEKRGSYETAARKMGIAEKVTFHGSIPEDEIANFYRNAHLFLLPSTDRRQEGFGLVLLEAMACARPVIASTIVGAARSIREVKAGFLVEPGSHDSLVDALRTAAGNPEACMAMGERGRRVVERSYTWEETARRYEELFEKILTERKA